MKNTETFSEVGVERLMKANLNALRYFVLVAQTGNLTRAAEALHVTQGAVSQQVSKLEEYLGTKLFDRQPRELVLTEAGRRLYRGVAPALREIDAQLQEARLQPHQAELSVTCNASFAAQCLLPALLNFEERHPQVRIRLETTTRLVDFAAAGIDIGVRCGNGGWPNITSEKMCVDQLVVVAAPEFAERHNLFGNEAAIADMALLYDLENPTEWRDWFAAAGLYDREPRTTRGFNDTLVLLRALRAGVEGVALVGRQLVCHELAAGELVQLSEVSVQASYAYYLVSAEDRPLSEPARQFRTWLMSWFADDAGAAYGVNG